MTPTVSIVIPCYNHAHYLAYALQSVLAQAYSDWEVIVVNDGSSDHTADIVAQFTDARIRYVYQNNQGLSAARNTGISVALGQYLAFVDADDGWEPAFLQRCVPLLAADATLAGVFTGNAHIDERGTRLPHVGAEKVAREGFRRRILEGGSFPPVAVLVRADIVREVGAFDTQLTSEEDWDLWIRISQRAQMLGIADVLARYRVYPGSMSTNAPRMHANRMRVLTKYFGAPEGDPATWPEEKRRAYGFAYRLTCIGHLQQAQPDQAWQYLAQAVSVWPRLLQRLDTFYELACGDKIAGQRGEASLLDLDESGAELLRRLEALFAAGGAPLGPMHRQAHSQAYLALSILSDQAGRWDLARRWLVKATVINPGLLLSFRVMRRLLKLYAGKRLVGVLQKLGLKQASV